MRSSQGYRAMARIEQQATHYRRGTRVIGKLLLAFIILSPLSATADEFTAKSPQGAVYDTRTHYYEPILQRVLPREEYKRISAEEKKAAYSELGIQLGPRDLNKWLAAQQRWQETVAERLTRATKLSAQRRKYLANNPRPLHYYYYYFPGDYISYYRPMTYFDYWHYMRGFSFTNSPNDYPSYSNSWLNFGY
jgi:hypothetical protein